MVASLRLLVLILVTCREMQWGILLYLYICREVAPVTGQPAADTTAGPWTPPARQGFTLATLAPSRFTRAALRPSWPLCGDTATHGPAQAPPLPTLASWWPCPSLSNCLEHRYAGPALQGFSCPALATLASIGQNGPPWPLCRTPRQPPRGVKAARDTMRKPQRFRQQKTPPASP